MVEPKSPAMQMLKISRERATKIAMDIINNEHDDIEKTIAVLEAESKQYEDVMDLQTKNRKYMEDGINYMDSTRKNTEALGQRLLEAVLKFVAKIEEIETVLQETKERLEETKKALGEVKTELGKKTSSRKTR